MLLIRDFPQVCIFLGDPGYLYVFNIISRHGLGRQQFFKLYFCFKSLLHSLFLKFDEEIVYEISYVSKINIEFTIIESRLITRLLW